MKIARAILICAALVCSTAMGFAQGVTNGGKVKTSGLITGRDGENLKVRTADMGNIVVVLSDDTKVEEPKGMFHARNKEMGMTALVPGLNIQINGMGNAQGQVAADTIKFSKKDLQVANEIQAGLVPTTQKVEANKQSIESNKQAIAANQQNIEANQQEIQQVNKRFSELTDYEVKDTATIYYKPGVAELDEKQKADLAQLAHNAANLKGYMVQVAGFCDSTGNPSQNEELSMHRAQNVVEYLTQVGNVPLRHIVAPGAMGEAHPAASNETAQGRAENRRVVVKVLVNKGLAGGE